MTLAFGTLAAGVSLTGLSGCNGIELPIEVTIPLVQNSSIVAANEADGTVDVVVGAFCDLFSAEQLDAMIREFGGDLVADLVEITRVELDAVTVTATAGDFDDFTSSTLSLSLLPIGSDPLALGAAANAEGLGTSFDLTQEEPVDLLNDLDDGECGVPTLRLQGVKPGADITFSTAARVKVFTRLSLQP